MRGLALTSVVTVVALVCASSGRAADIPYWPSQQEKRLSQLEKQSLELLQQLFVARMQPNEADASRLSKEFGGVQKERVELMRALGQLPPPKQ